MLLSSQLHLDQSSQIINQESQCPTKVNVDVVKSRFTLRRPTPLKIHVLVGGTLCEETKVRFKL